MFKITYFKLILPTTSRYYTGNTNNNIVDQLFPLDIMQL